MNEDRKDTRTVWRWYSHETPDENARRLAADLAPKVVETLVDAEGIVNRLHDGRPIAADKEFMRTLITTHFRGTKLRPIGDGRWEFVPCELEFFIAGSRRDLLGMNDRTLLAVRDALRPFIEKMPLPPRELKESHKKIVEDRLRSGEPAHIVGANLNLDTDQVREIGRQAGIMVH
jgi:hypothetical protein